MDGDSVSTDDDKPNQRPSSDRRTYGTGEFSYAFETIGGDRFESRARFTRTTLVPAAYRSKVAARD